MEDLYRDASEKPVESTFTFNESIVLQALNNIYSKGVNTKVQIDDRLYEEVRRVFNEATDVGYGKPQTSSAEEFINQIKTNNDVFSAFKVHRMGRDMTAQLLDEKGNLKHFAQFVKDTEGIIDHHVMRWLRTEYDTAIKRARKAADMAQFQAEKDVLPNLKWLPSTAVTPREEHIPFYNRVWPMDAPFWDENQPGDKWGCQCDWTATDEPVTDNSGIDPTAIKPAPGLKGNPGKTGQLFSDDHPYFPSECAGCPFSNRPLSVFTNKVKDCYDCKNIVEALRRVTIANVFDEYNRLKANKNYVNVKLDKKSGGLSAVHKEHRFDSVKGVFGIRRGDYERLAIEVLRKHGYMVVLESELAVAGVKTPDGRLNGVVMDIKGIESAGKWTIKSKFESANKQGAHSIVLYFHDKTMYSEEYVLNSWKTYIERPDRKSQNIEQIICVVEDDCWELKP